MELKPDLEEFGEGCCPSCGEEPRRRGGDSAGLLVLRRAPRPRARRVPGVRRACPRAGIARSRPGQAWALARSRPACCLLHSTGGVSPPRAHLLRRATVIVALHVGRAAPLPARRAGRDSRRSFSARCSTSRVIACRTRTSARVASRSGAVARASSSSPRDEARSIRRRLAPRRASAPDLEHVLPSYVRADGSSFTTASAGTVRGASRSSCSLCCLARSSALIAPRRRAL